MMAEQKKMWADRANEWATAGPNKDANWGYDSSQNKRIGLNVKASLQSPCSLSLHVILCAIDCDVKEQSAELLYNTDTLENYFSL